MELLEQLTIQTGCVYLSDLKYLSNNDLLKEFVKETEPTKYDIHEWNDAIKFLTGKTAAFSTPQDAKDYLVKMLTRA